MPSSLKFLNHTQRRQKYRVTKCKDTESCGTKQSFQSQQSICNWGASSTSSKKPLSREWIRRGPRRGSVWFLERAQSFTGEKLPRGVEVVAYPEPIFLTTSVKEGELCGTSTS